MSDRARHYVKTPARRAVEHALTWRVPITAQELASYASLEIGGANRYLGTLVTLRVLVLTTAGYIPGPKAEAWRKKQPKTRVGGSDANYRRQKAVLDLWREKAWKQDTGKAPVPVLTSEIAPNCNNQSQTVANDDREGEVTYSISAAARILGVSRMTMHRRISSGVMKTVRLGGLGAPRVSDRELKRITEQTS